MGRRGRQPYKKAAARLTKESSGFLLPLSRLRPIKALVQEGERTHAVDLVHTVEILNRRSVADAKPAVQLGHLGVFIGHPFIETHGIVVPSLHHEGAWCDHTRKLGVVECVAHVEIKDLVLGGEHVRSGEGDARRLPDPLVEVR